MKRKFLLLMMVLVPAAVHADYDANFRGKILDVITYPYNDTILIRVENQPKSHPICGNFDYLALDAGVEEHRRQYVFARMLAAYAAGEVVNIGYDSKDLCSGDRIRIYRVG
ncbi:hypothetical protein [Agaribacterium haliotis]|uniref:hypothetical protein n=1 Tax=Agaribacterium haliotis TaxID=2013869 RepID=UPI000BB57463|nr:hypothetical protein [Agaribacterium haliotis]